MMDQYREPGYVGANADSCTNAAKGDSWCHTQSSGLDRRWRDRSYKSLDSRRASWKTPRPARCMGAL